VEQLKTYPEGMLISIVGHDVNSSSSTYTILLGESLTASKNYSLDIPFISLVSDKLEGLYRSSYKDEMGNTKLDTKLFATYKSLLHSCKSLFSDGLLQHSFRSLELDKLFHVLMSRP